MLPFLHIYGKLRKKVGRREKKKREKKKREKQLCLIMSVKLEDRFGLNMKELAAVVVNHALKLII
jgi:hypothetical protein